MKVTTKKDFSKRGAAGCLVIPFFEAKKAKAASNIDLFEEIKAPIEALDFTGKKEEIALVYLKGKQEPRALLLGLGKEEEITEESIRNSFAAAVKKCQQLRASKINLVFPKKCRTEHLFRSVLEGLNLSNYFFHKLKKDSLHAETVLLLDEVEIVGVDEKDKEEIEKVKIISTGVHLVRDLVNNNADEITPQKLAEVAKEFEKISPKVKVTVFDKKRIEEEKMGLLLAVNRASFRDPAFIIVEYLPSKSDDRTVLIGKGITFDSGGLSLKPTESMIKMKTDMSGAAAVLGVIYVAAKLNLNKNIIAVVPATENSIGSKSYKPGDVYSSYSGKTVEVLNTDAEGRLILADAISYAVKNLKPKRMIDIASLTGAVAIALGEEIAGLFCNDKEMAKKLLASGLNTGELLWELPLHPEYKKLIKSDIADLKNVAQREGSCITAALFLEDFVGKIPWAHIDIGSTACYNKTKGYYTSAGTGYGLRLIYDFLENL